MSFILRKLLRVTLFVLCVSASCSYADAQAKEAPIKAIATFSILGDMVATVGGDRVAVTTLVGPDSDTHIYNPTPADAKNILEADILFVNGFEFEGWLDRLIDASGYKGKIVVATTGIKGLSFADKEEHGDHAKHDDEHKDEHDDHDKHGDAHKDEHDDHDHEKHGDAHKDEHDEHGHDKHADKHEDEHDDHDKHAKHDDEHEGEHEDEHGHHHHHHGDTDPHAWHSLAHAKTYINNITQALQQADPKGSDEYDANRDAYLEKIALLEWLVTKTLDKLPEDRRTVVTSHDAFGYFAKSYGLRFIAPQGMSTKTEASAKNVALLIEQIRDENIKALFIENMVSSRLLEQIADESGAKIGGKLYSDALSRSDAEAGTYLKMMKHNILTVYQTLKAAD